MYEELKDQIEAAVARLHERPHLFWILETGVCGHLLFDLWRMPGSSASILNFGLPYHRRVQTNMLDRCVGESFASDTHAIYLATYAYEQAFKVVSQEGKAGTPVVGVGITGAVTTSRERRGEDRVHVAVRTVFGIHLVSVTLPKVEDHARDAKAHRAQQGILTDLIALNMMLWSAGTEQIPLSEDCVSPQKRFLDSRRMTPWVLTSQAVEPHLEILFDTVFWPEGPTTPVADLDPKEIILFPGSYKPLTYAHIEMARMIEGMTGKRVVFQISQQHPDKAIEPLSEAELRRRLLQFSFRHPVLFLRGSGLYVEKAKLVPGVQVLVGADAAKAILNPRYYGGDGGRRAMLEELDRLGSSFLVMGRFNPVTREFEMRDDLDMPPRFAHLFEGVSARWDISSTELRAQIKD